MAVEIVTIVNSSGKIISNGKHLVNVFKEAKAAYDEKKAAVKAERAVRRAQTYDIPTVPRYEPEPTYNYEYGHDDYDPRYAHDDGVSQTSSRRSHRSSVIGHTLATTRYLSLPLRGDCPKGYGIERPTLARAPTMPVQTQVIAPIDNTYMQRSISDPALPEMGKKKKEIDMNLAYGSIPPDLADRVDLDPAYQAAEKETKARNLVGKIEDLLVEAQCLHHTATHIIEHLQGKPEAAAAVALTLAELSALLGKMSPSFLAVIKGGSPAIFALLASPQFLIAAGLTVGVTVVMFGGWKIIKRIKEAKEAEAAIRMAPMAFEAQPVQLAQPIQPVQPAQPVEQGQPVYPPYPPSEASQGFDEALVVEEELSTIETWRRGITPFGEDDTADLELISPEADRAIRSQYGGDDSRTERSVRTSRTHKSSKSHKSHRSHRSRAHDDSDIPERKSSRSYDGGDGASESGSHRSHHSHRSHQSHQSHRSEKTERSSKSKRSTRTELKAIEDGSREKDNTLEAVLRPKKDNMLKSLFKKKKKKEEEELVRSSSKVRV
ncbi:hypothetical protein CIB48_g8435 [Xylaria polymorpha]|nr:hypothetical protein CIB48_g8435 [Xylaria polymorpha]